MYKKFALLKNPASFELLLHCPIKLWKPSPPPEPLPEIPVAPPQVPSGAIFKPVSLLAFATANTFDPLYPLYV